MHRSMGTVRKGCVFLVFWVVNCIYNKIYVSAPGLAGRAFRAEGRERNEPGREVTDLSFLSNRVTWPVCSFSKEILSKISWVKC